MLDHGGIPADLKELIEAFYAKAEEIPNEHARVLDREPPPATIYHYTDGAGLRGILENGNLRLTDIFSLNDPTELRHGMNYAIDALREAADRGGDEVRRFHNDFRKFCLGGGLEASAHFFVCCFSRADDDLGQWRAYADNGRGYALGFDGALLETAFAKHGPGPDVVPGYTTFPIVYDDAQLSDMQRRIVAEAAPLISAPRGRKMPAEILAAYLSELSVNLTVPIIRAALFFKHKAYRNEDEYRFMQVERGDRPAEKVKYRGRPYALVRYTEFDWKAIAPAALKEIIVGPAADPAIAGRYVQDCLRAYHPTSNVRIKSSQIPYRAP